ncbi:hypothetical protein NMS_2171 [Nonlabens marinus S1-08]|uniref:Lipocalin-like domain-containing protein n=2 Tax=Nonlabens TaxID=363408 RepID=W8VSG6_9FLAO|nr:hypothetical protein NMS_2171 [Nonlabens marinus S1-08]
MIMRFLAVFVLAILTTSCDDQEVDNDLIGAWKHVESLSDIGDGKATFHRVNSDKTLLFTAYGTVISNENVCMGNNFQEGTVATWNPSDKGFQLEDCKATYTLDKEIGVLVVNYQCMEACAEKYVRAD